MDGESVTLTGLDYGDYFIDEVVPMNFSLVSISDGGMVAISKDDKVASITVKNEYEGDGWFYDDDERKNNFYVGIVAVNRNFMRESSIDLERDAILPKEEFLLQEPVLEKEENDLDGVKTW